MRVRDLRRGDAADWRRLFRDYTDFYETPVADDVLDRVWSLLLAGESGIHGLAALDEDRVVGFAHYRWHVDTFSGGRDWYLDDLYVDVPARGAGAATALIEEIAARASEAGGGGTLRWITAADNAAAQRVYDRLATRTAWVTYERRI